MWRRWRLNLTAVWIFFLAANEASVPTGGGFRPEPDGIPENCGASAGGGFFFLDPAPKVQVVDANGNDVNQAGIVVRAEDANTSDSVTFSGVTEETTDANGVAEFNDLTVDDCSEPNLLKTTFVLTSPGFDPPQLDPNNDSFTVPEDSGTTSLAVTDNDSFGPNGPGNTAISITSAPGNGDAEVDNRGTPSPGDDQVNYTPAANFFGTDSFVYQIEDSTGATSTATVTITVEPVNDPPGFSAGPDQAINEITGPVTVPGWASAISVGPANESAQSITGFNVSNDNNALFTIQPDVDATGTLSYEPAPGANGSATVSVTLSDDGGTANGGADTSAPRTFVITIDSAADLTIAMASSTDTAAPGDTFDFLIDVSNGGPSPADDVLVSATLPAEVTLVETSGCAEDPTGVPTCSLGRLEVGDMRSVLVTVQLDNAAPSLDGSASVASAVSDPAPADNAASAALSGDGDGGDVDGDGADTGSAMPIPSLGPLALLMLSAAMLCLGALGARRRFK